MGIKEWLVEVAVKKALGKALTSFVGSLIVFIPVLKNYGVNIELDEQLLSASALALVMGGYEFLRNFLKQKSNVKLP